MEKMERSRMIFAGRVNTHSIFADGIFINNNLQLVNHSPDGFSWGYAGSGPAQCSFMVLFTYFTKVKMYDIKKAKLFTQRFYQDFKFDVISQFDSNSDWLLPSYDIEAWLNVRKIQDVEEAWVQEK
jgi:hypothetical protein